MNLILNMYDELKAEIEDYKKKYNKMPVKAPVIIMTGSISPAFSEYLADEFFTVYHKEFLTLHAQGVLPPGMSVRPV